MKRTVKLIGHTLAVLAGGFFCACAVYAPGAESNDMGLAAILTALIVGGALGHMLFVLGDPQ